ncbi:MAG: amino acid adenylation domain-containing protein [Proteobacteria bacterium]|nr:amino acid adenylation domain-containing protein [Pseudomonadota bacterium]
MTQDPRVVGSATGDDAIRWQPGEKLHHLFERRCDLLDAEGQQGHLAVDAGVAGLTFRELDNRANQLARFLRDQGIGQGDRIALLVDDSIHTYVALLGVLKAGGAYVPLDPSFPDERVGFILSDARVKAVLSLSGLRAGVAAFDLPAVLLDADSRKIAAQPTERLAGEAGPAGHDLCYIVYTSGTTGKPKGVPVGHPSICNFVKVAAEVYGYETRDRVYQGMTIAFDFSVEELWVPLIVGATLVPAKPGANLVGEDLEAFLRQRRVTVLACVPTLLATLEGDLPDLRVLLVSGEACPQGLVAKWHRPGRIFLNAYGPTEATVTATLARLHPDKPVTIGKPLPTYSVVILDCDRQRALPRGETGEIGIAGIALADGYLNREDLTRKSFVPDFMGIPHNPSKRIYRTGDLGRVNGEGEIEYLGRRDTQVKLRGYRIELGEIEAALEQVPEVSQAVADTLESQPGSVDLVAYYTRRRGASAVQVDKLVSSLAALLPRYMIPAYFEELGHIPTTAAHKVDRKRLPKPTSARVTGVVTPFVAPRTEKEEALAGWLAEALDVDRVSIKDNFFDDLGAHSLLMAGYCSVVRRHWPAARVSMRDIYLHPTIEQLAGVLQLRAKKTPPAGDTPLPNQRSTLCPVNGRGAEPAQQAPPALHYYACGAAQLVAFLLYGLGALWLAFASFGWAHAAWADTAQLFVRLACVSGGLFFGLSALPVLAKWLLIGRWKPEVFPVWGLRYFRFWLVKTLICNAPIALLLRSPVYNVYLRLLGAHIGRNVVFENKTVPICTDLVSIGDDAVVRKDAFLTGYRAHSNHIHIGAVTIGAHAYVGTSSILDIDTVLEDGAQLAHASSLQSGQRTLGGKSYHGSPAEETDADFRGIAPLAQRRLRRVLYSIVQLAGLLALNSGLFTLVLGLYSVAPSGGASVEGSAEQPSLAHVTRLVELAAQISANLYFGLLALGLLAVGLLPRALGGLLKDGRTYPLYGVHYGVYQLVSAISNSRIYNILFGDSSYILGYLKWVGYRLPDAIQTGSNFGLSQVHDFPFLCTVGSGTMVSDGLIISNAHISSSSFKLESAAIGERNYLGNRIHFPAGACTGANCLLGTKVMVPTTGPIRQDTGLLGSPAFEIPRAVSRDARAMPKYRGRELAKKLARKLAYNTVTILIFLLAHWFYTFGVLFVGHLGVILHYQRELWGLCALLAFMPAFTFGLFAGIERASLGFGRLTPKLLVTLYDRRFWRHERHWKLSGHPFAGILSGTPFRNVISRLLGVRQGKRVFDDGCAFLDKTLISVGDFATFNDQSIVQGHSLEEGAFKTDRVRIGASCTLGPGSFVHYGVETGDRVYLAADSYLMKGERPEDGSTWAGNPAKDLGKSETPPATDLCVTSPRPTHEAAAASARHGG